MKKSLFLSGTIITLLFISFFFINDYKNAESEGDKLKADLQKLKEAQAALADDIELTAEQMQEIEDAQHRLEEEIKRVDLAISVAIQNIADKNEEIVEIESEIEVLREDIDALIVRLQKRDELIKNRMRSIQENGGTIDYINVILGASSFGDFIDRVSAVTTIIEQDKRIIQKHQDEMDQLSTMKNSLTDKLDELESQLVELEKLNEELKNQRADKEVVLGQLVLKHEELHAILEEKEDDKATLKAQEEAKKVALADWEAEEKRRREEEAAAKKRKDIEERSGLPAGTFIRPSQGPVTSEYGPRWGGTHTGIDLGRNGYMESAVASAAGVVFKAEYYGGYGNVVFITHNIEGLTFTTTYAHLDRIDVSVGQKVAQGEHLGLVGNTGYSTGPHLHFELIEGDWDSRYSNRVNPRDYIDF